MDRHIFTFNFMPEIEEKIFEITARMHPKFAPTLTLVSKRIQTRVEYIIYESIVLCSRNASNTYHMSYSEKFEYTLHARPAEFFARRVRNLGITNTVPKQMTPLILSVCTGVRNLVVWQRRDPLKFNAAALIIPLSFTLSSLSTDRLTIRRMAESQVVFPHIVCLSVLCWPDEPLPSLEWLPVLTTVLLLGFPERSVEDEDTLVEDAETVISTVPLLQSMVVEVPPERYDEDALIRIKDSRIRMEIESGGDFSGMENLHNNVHCF